jgi:hypothetical protein
MFPNFLYPDWGQDPNLDTKCRIHIEVNSDPKSNFLPFENVSFFQYQNFSTGI